MNKTMIDYACTGLQSFSSVLLHLRARVAAGLSKRLRRVAGRV